MKGSSFPLLECDKRKRWPTPTFNSNFLRRFGLCSLLGALFWYFLPNLSPLGGLSKLSGVRPAKIHDKLEWHACSQDSPDVDCATLRVPTDYLDSTKGDTFLALARYKATDSPKQGTIFINPGGPGGSGVSFILRAGSALAKLLGEKYDLISFDPRGIGLTRPAVRCFPSPLHQQFFVSNTVFEQGFTVSSNLTDPRTRDQLIQQYKEFLAMKKSQAELCAENMGDTLKYMGSTTVARDIDFMTTFFDGSDALINYWGGSYGTILGAYLVNMFPDRVGRVAIDGVANPVLWADKPSQYWHADWLSSAEDTYNWFLQDCSKAGPEACPLAHFKGENPSDIEKRIDRFLDDLYDSPLPVPFADRPGYLTAGGVRAMMLIFMEGPVRWPLLARFLANAMEGDGSALLNLLLPKYTLDPGPPLSGARDLQRLAVTCLDSPPPSSPEEFPSPEELADIGLATISNVSRHFGMSVSISEPDGGCQFWPVRPPERFTGPWNHTLKNPILIVSNTADPVTPIASGRLVNKLLSNSSRLLVQNSPGHCSLALPSLCTIKAYRAYYLNGTLPDNELVCEVDASAFPGSIQATGMVNTMSRKDIELLENARKIGDWLMTEKFDSAIGGSDTYEIVGLR